MFDFKKLDVYIKAKTFNHEINHFIIENNLTIDRIIKDQLKRSSLSIALNIAEGTSRFSKKDKRNFYIISWESTFECAAILDILNKQLLITDQQYKLFYSQGEELSKILFTLIKKLSE